MNDGDGGVILKKVIDGNTLYIIDIPQDAGVKVNCWTAPKLAIVT